jgi:hypothetical protein
MEESAVTVNDSNLLRKMSLLVRAPFRKPLPHFFMIIRMDEGCHRLTRTRGWRHPKVGGGSLIYVGKATAGINFEHKLITGLHNTLQTFHLRQAIGESNRIDWIRDAIGDVHSLTSPLRRHRVILRRVCQKEHSRHYYRIDFIKFRKHAAAAHERLL